MIKKEKKLSALIDILINTMEIHAVEIDKLKDTVAKLVAKKSPKGSCSAKVATND